MIKTWDERCAEHPDHQTGMVTERMIVRRMQEEIAELRAALAQPEQDLQLVANLLKEYGLEALEVIAALKTQPEQEPVAVVAMDVSGVHMSYGGQYLGQKPDTKIAMLLKDLPVGTHLYVAVGMGVSNE